MQSNAEQQADFLGLSLACLDQHRVLPMFKRQKGRMGRRKKRPQDKARHGTGVLHVAKREAQAPHFKSLVCLVFPKVLIAMEE